MTNSISEIGQAACIFVIGSNTTAAHPIIGRQITRAVKQGSKLLVADPRRTVLRRMADIWIRHRPGTDVALLNGMAKIILDDFEASAVVGDLDLDGDVDLGDWLVFAEVYGMPIRLARYEPSASAEEKT